MYGKEKEGGGRGRETGGKEGEIIGRPTLYCKDTNKRNCEVENMRCVSCQLSCYIGRRFQT